MGLSVEPFGSLSYVRSQFHDLPVPGGEVQLADVTSFRGSLGLRVSTTVDLGGYQLKPTLFGRAWDEWKGTDQTTLINPGSPVLATDRFRGVFGEAGSQVAVFSKGRFSALVTSSYKWKTGYREYQASLGARYQF